jgi:hypothetical protein
MKLVAAAPVEAGGVEPAELAAGLEATGVPLTATVELGNTGAAELLTAGTETLPAGAEGTTAGGEGTTGAGAEGATGAGVLTTGRLEGTRTVSESARWANKSCRGSQLTDNGH